MKKCSKCSSIKPLSEFHKTKQSKDGYKTECKSCRSIYAKQKRIESGGINRIDRSIETFDLKICTKCLELKDRKSFKKSSWCLECKQQYYRNNSKAPVRFIPIVTDTHKQCAECKKLIELSNFSLSKRGRLGLSAYCKPCASLRIIKSVPVEVRREKTQYYRNKNRNWWRSLHRINQFNRIKKQKLVSDGTVTKEFIESVYNIEKCYYCKEKVPKDLRTLEHILPLNRGGLHSINNITMACSKCNNSKRDMTEKEFEIFNYKKYEKNKC